MELVRRASCALLTDLFGVFFPFSLPTLCFAVELMYWEVMRLRREMSLAKLGFYPSEM